MGDACTGWVCFSCVLQVIPGSGPTDRDGNSPLGITAAPYRLLAESLAEKGISTVRIDKRGLFGSKGAVADANKVTIADYATDTYNWVAAIRQRTGTVLTSVVRGRVRQCRPCPTCSAGRSAFSRAALPAPD